MTAPEEPNSSRPNYGRRLLPNIVDETAAAEPDRPYAYAPLSNKPEDGWGPITFKQLATAVDRVARIAADTIKAESTEAFPTVAYIGPNDIRYAVVMLATIKAGCQALFISPRNSEEGQLSLFERTKCDHIWYADSFEELVQPWLGKRQMKATKVSTFETWLESNPEPFPYNPPFDKARFDPMVVLHTSGSTGIPKPIVVRQGAVAVADGHRNLPRHQGGQIIWRAWQDHATRFFLPMPLFHAAALDAGIVVLAMMYQVPIALGMPNQPLTADLTIKCLKHAGVDAAFLPPSIIEELSNSEEGLEALKKLSFVTFGGGALTEAAGDTLVKHGVVLNNVIASTELMPYVLYYQKRQELWQYFIFNSELMGADWKCIDPEDNIYEMRIRRKDPRDPLDQPCFYTFPDLENWSTGDLYKPHPSLPNHWIYHGRGDDVIVFSTGEKLNPVTIENHVFGHPSVKGAMVVGQERFQPALIVEPHVTPSNDEEAKAFIDKLWPLVEEANKSSVAHGRIARRLIALSDPKLPFPRASKGTIQRGTALKMYKDHINTIYKRADEVEAVPLDFGSQEALTQSILAMLTSNVGAKDVEPDTDLFTIGVDSQQVMTISSILRSSTKSAGVSISREALAPRVIYANPTPASLAEYLLAQTKEGGDAGEDDEAREVKKMERLIAKYTTDLPASNANKPDPLDEGQTVLLTGSTGSLGAYLLDRLCKSPDVKKIVALNRGADGGASRQASISTARDLGTDYSKVEFLGSDLAKPDLGLGSAKYAELLAQADRIIHNAWPVNFNISVTSFEPNIRGVRHLVDFANAAAKRVPIVFLSTIGTAELWSSQEPVPESRLDDFSVAAMGYGRSKLAGSEILQAASDHSGVPAATIRVGQIAGPRGAKGMWNKQEFIPSLIASSLYLGILPAHIGAGEVVDWIPIEDMAGLILDVGGITVRQPVSQVNGYFHGVNPAKTKWGELAPALAEYYGGRIKKLVSMEEWVKALKASEGAGADLDKNPAVKLIDTYDGMLKASRAGIEHINFEMKKTVKHSPTVARLSPITPDLLRNWCGQWNF